MRQSAIILLLLAIGCSKAPPGGEVVMFAVSGRATPDMRSQGAGAWRFSSSLGNFEFQTGRMVGEPWLKATGKMTMGESNDVKISLQSKSDRPYELQLLGLSTNDNPDLPESAATQTFQVPSGEHSLNFDGFVIYTYDFRPGTP